jgi:hypothetical protein
MKDNRKEFYLMNRDAMYFQGLLCGDILWTNDQDEAKTFKEPSKIKAIRRWKPQEKIQIVYK